MNGTLDAAREKGLPIWTAQHWLDFITARQSARFEGLAWKEKELAFDLVIAQPSKDRLSLLIPLEHNQSPLQRVRVDGKDSQPVRWSVGGVTYGLVILEPGSHHLDAAYA